MNRISNYPEPLGSLDAALTETPYCVTLSGREEHYFGSWQRAVEFYRAALERRGGQPELFKLDRKTGQWDKQVVPPIVRAVRNKQNDTYSIYVDGILFARNVANEQRQYSKTQALEAWEKRQKENESAES